MCDVRTWWRTALVGGCLALIFSAPAQGQPAGAVAQSHADEQLAELKDRADQGDSKAQSRLGMAYTFGKGVDQDYEQARIWLREAAAQDDAAAQTVLGYLYRDGLGVAADTDKARRWYQRAARLGHPVAQTNLALLYKQAPSPDLAAAMEWFRKAAEQDNAYAQANLGRMYENGEGVEVDFAVALRWYEKAAAHGHARAQKRLAGMYEHGRGVDQNLVTAYMWYSIAGVWQSEGEVLPEDDPRLRLQKEMSSDQVEEAKERASAWWMEHFKQGQEAGAL